MPTVLHEDGFRFWFYAGDRNEPAHVHVGKGGAEAKWWLDPLGEARSYGFGKADRRRIARIVKEYQPFLLSEWGRFFAH
jgi:hypothetical protein